MTLTCKFEELDDETRAYLRTVRSRRGRGTPGVYVHIDNPKPFWAVLAGPIVAAGLIWFSLGSSKDPWAVALLQTAGLLVGGWCVAYALRRWFVVPGDHYGGYFAYFDPLNAYQVQGETVTVTDVRNARRVEANGNRVLFDLGDRRSAVIVPNAVQAELVEEYYAAMGELERQEDGRWRHAPPAELGAAARMAVEEDQVPQKPAHLDLDLDRLPADPKREGRAGLGWPALLAIPAITAGLFLALWAVNRPLGDELAFERAKEDGAPGLRGYLLDDRNTRHREEAKRLLAQHYDAPIARLKGPPAAQNPELRDGMVLLLEMLRTSNSPVVSIDVTEEGQDLASTLRATELRREVADGLARGIGPQLIAFAEPPPGQPGHVSIRYRLAPADAGTVTATTTVEFRTDLGKDPVARGSWEAIPAAAAVLQGLAVNQIRAAICRELVGEYVPPPPMNFGGGDF
jgi:hypothetical protein